MIISDQEGDSHVSKLDDGEQGVQARAEHIALRGACFESRGEDVVLPTCKA